jgi:riboflavin transporter FmnP
MKKEAPWWILLILAAVAYLLSYLLGGYIGTVLNVLGLIFLVFGIIRIFSKKKAAKDRQ